MARRLSSSVAAAFAGILLALPAHAAPDDSQFTWGNMTVIDAKDLLSSWPETFNYKTEVAFTFQNTVQARDFIKKGF